MMSINRSIEQELSNLSPVDRNFLMTMARSSGIMGLYGDLRRAKGNGQGGWRMAQSLINSRRAESLNVPTMTGRIGEIANDMFLTVTARTSYSKDKTRTFEIQVGFGNKDGIFFPNEVMSISEPGVQDDLTLEAKERVLQMTVKAIGKIY